MDTYKQTNNRTNKQIKEYNKHVKEALYNWATIVLDMDATNISFHLKYNNYDLSNALLIFQHVFQNIAIKKGLIPSSEVAELVGNDMHDFIEKFTGVDIRKIYE